MEVFFNRLGQHDIHTNYHFCLKAVEKPCKLQKVKFASQPPQHYTGVIWNTYEGN
jgi:hypothetical protein